MPAVDSKTVPVARSVLITPPPWLGQYPPREHVIGTSPPGGHVNTEHSSKRKQLNKHSQWQNYLALKLTSLTRGRCAHKTPSPALGFWQLAPCKPPAHSPWTGPSTWAGLDGAPPPGLESPATPVSGWRKPAGMFLRIRSDIFYFKISLHLNWYHKFPNSLTQKTSSLVNRVKWLERPVNNREQINRLRFCTYFVLCSLTTYELHNRNASIG